MIRVDNFDEAIKIGAYLDDYNDNKYRVNKKNQKKVQKHFLQNWFCLFF